LTSINGHSKLEITQRYAHASGADLAGAMARLSTKPPQRPWPWRRPPREGSC